MKRPEESITLPYKSEAELIMATKIFEWIEYAKHLEKRVDRLETFMHNSILLLEEGKDI